MKYLNELRKYNEENGVLINTPIARAMEKHERIHARAMAGVYQYKPGHVEKAIEFIENEFYKTTGVLELIKLQPAQKWWLELWFGYYTADGDVLINETFLNIIRGAGKSTIMAAVEIYWMIYGGAFGGESIIVAYDNNQAEHMYGQVRNQITAGDGILRAMGDEKYLKTTKTGITFTPNKNELRKQTNDTHRAQGGNSSLNIFDEIHVYDTDIVSVINKGSRQKQKSWRSIYITSGGVVREKLYDEMIARFTSEDEFESDRSIGLIYRLDDAQEVHDPENWTKAAPMMPGGLPRKDAVMDEYNLAKNDPAKQIQFLAYNMGVSVNNSDKYITEDEAKRTDYDFDDIWLGADVVAGVDLSLVQDITAVAFLTERDGKIYVHVEGLCTQSTLDQVGEAMRPVLENMDGLKLVQRPIISAHDVAAVFNDFKDRTGCNFTFVGYDRAMYDTLKDILDVHFFDRDDELQKPVTQGFGLSEYIKTLKELLKLGKVVHNSHLLRWSLLNFAITLDPSGRLKATKLAPAEKIDPVIAVINALKTYLVTTGM